MREPEPLRRYLNARGATRRTAADYYRLAEQIEQEQQRRQLERLASFTGECITCFDEDIECSQCERGLAVIAAREASMRQDARYIWLTKRGIGVEFLEHTLATYPGDRTIIPTLEAWCEAWSGEEWLALTGKVGVGKTGLAVSCLKAIDHKRTWPVDRFITSAGMLTDCREAISAGRGDAAIIKTYSRADLLILDDLGAEKPTDYTISVLFQVLNWRYEHRLPTWFTSNYAIGGDNPSLRARVGERVYDRIVGRSTVIALAGKSLRGKS